VPVSGYHIAVCVQNAPVIVGSLEKLFSKPEDVSYIRIRRQSKYKEGRTVPVR
jgi:hypothetical protein